MSMGFLTESALIPQKGKEIKIDSSHIIGLKTALADAEQKLLSDPKVVTKKRHLGPIQMNKREEEDYSRNEGVDERIQKDEASLKSRTWKGNLQNLERKADEYKRMQNGEYVQGYEDSNVIFHSNSSPEIYSSENNQMENPFHNYISRDEYWRQKNSHEDNVSHENTNDDALYAIDTGSVDRRDEGTKRTSLDSLEEAMKNDRFKEVFLQNRYIQGDVLILDEFGRYRWVPEGCDEHMNNIGSAYRIKQLMVEYENNKQLKQYKHSNNRNNDSKTSMTKASKVKMTWEKGPSEKEKLFIQQIEKENADHKAKRVRMPTKSLKEKKEKASALLDTLLS
ncbi:hypothetical protein WA158_007408 [Blastocystis sp. Blastoise]